MNSINDNAKTLALMFDILGNAPRLRILNALSKCSMAPNVQKLSELTGLNDRLISAHMQILRDRGYVSSERSGKTVLWILVEWKRDQLVNVIDQIFSKDNVVQAKGD